MMKCVFVTLLVFGISLSFGHGVVYEEESAEIESNAETESQNKDSCTSLFHQLLENNKQSANGLDNTRGGTVYTRWGKATCPDTPGTELVYDGIVAKGYATLPGSGVNYQCLSKEPRYRRIVPDVQSGRAYIDGTEYEAIHSKSGPLAHVNFQGAICAVCYTPVRGTNLMIPGTTICPKGWTSEYTGYLMAERFNHASASTFECVDEYAEALKGTSSDKNTHGGLFMSVESRCENFLCPPYTKGAELTCAVCTK